MDPNELQTNSMSANHLQDLTSVITVRLYSHLEKEAIMSPDTEERKTAMDAGIS